MDFTEAKQAVLDRNGLAWFKYVRIGDEFRFLEIEETHKLYLGENEEATSAGTVKIRPGEIEVCDYSMTLNIGPTTDDQELIAKIFSTNQKE